MANPFRLPPSAFRLRRAMSLIEVLISMFVLLFGLMGVAAIFPVGNYYVVEGEKFDLASGIAQNAFEELRARGMLKPVVWYYANYPIPTGTNPPPPVLGDPVINPATNEFFLTLPTGPGHVFVIDPMGSAATTVLPAERLFLPWNANALSNPWSGVLSGNQWPVRRITLPIPSGTMTTPVAETIFRLRDDLAVEQPKESDLPSIQRWDVDNTTATPRLLRRQYKGNYSWLATIVPTTGAGLAALQPSNADYGEIGYDVSIVVFRKRDEIPSAASERLIEAELLLGGELVIFDRNNIKQNVDDAVEDLRPGNWISLMGVNQTTGDFVMKWYRLLSLDNETIVNQNVSSVTGQVSLRRAMLIGPDWPAPTVGNVVTNLRAGILPSVISVVTKPLRMEDTSLWNLE